MNIDDLRRTIEILETENEVLHKRNKDLWISLKVAETTGLQQAYRQGAAEYNVCRWLCTRSVAEERADAHAHAHLVAKEGIDYGLEEGLHVGAAAKGRP